MIDVGDDLVDQIVHIRQQNQNQQDPEQTHLLKNAHTCNYNSISSSPEQQQQKIGQQLYPSLPDSNRISKPVIKNNNNNNNINDYTQTGSNLDTEPQPSDNSSDPPQPSPDPIIYDAFGNVFPPNLNPEFLSVPVHKRPNHVLLLAGFAFFVIGFAASIPSVLDALSYLICRQNFPESSKGGEGELFASLSNGQNDWSKMTLFNGMSMANGISTGYRTQANETRSPAGFIDPRCFSPDVNAAVGIFQSYQTIINAVFSSITIPLISSLSDRIGRKIPLLLCAFTCILSLVVTFLCTTFPSLFSVNFMLLGSAIEGLGGSVLLIGILLSAYISDTVRETHRAPMLSISDSILYGGLALGPFVGSTFLKMTNHSINGLFLFSIVVELVVLGVFAVWLPESRSERLRKKSVSHFNQRRKSSAASSSSSSRSGDNDATRPLLRNESAFAWISNGLKEAKDNLLHPLYAFKLSHIPRSQPRMRLNVYILMATFSIIVEIGTSVMPLIFLYAKLQFQWTSVENGYFLSVLAGSRFIVLAFVLPAILSYTSKNFTHSQKYIDPTDMFFLRFGLFVSVTAYLLLSKAPNGTFFLLATLLFALSSCETPILKNTLMKFAERGKVAELLGLSQFMARVGSILGPALLAIVFQKSAKKRPQLVLELVADVFIVLLIAINFLYVGPPKGVGVDVGEGDGERDDEGREEQEEEEGEDDEMEGIEIDG